MTRCSLLLWSVVALAACSSGSERNGDGGTGDRSIFAADSALSDAGGADRSIADAATNLPARCAVTTGSFAPNPCPAITGQSGMVSFCFRSGWPGITSVDVYGGFGQSGDWTSPFFTLTDDGTGTFTGTTALADGTYPYLFRTHGGADNLTHDGQYLLDEQNPAFTPHPAAAPIARSVSVVTVPQGPAAPLYHLRGTVVYEGRPQPCYAVALEVGELRSGSKALSEHYTANFSQSGADGTFDFPVAAGEVSAIVRYPFLLAGPKAPYPDPSVTPSVGITRTTIILGGDRTLDPAEISYPGYAALSATTSLPATFHYSVIPGSSAATFSIIGTNIAGNDPSYIGTYGTQTSATWDGVLLGTAGMVVPGKQYFWGTWQKQILGPGSTAWVSESLLFPITFQ